MSEAKFTPGPWASNNPERRRLVYSMTNALPVARVLRDGFSKEAADANQHLISAATQLYAACEEAAIMLRLLSITLGADRIAAADAADAIATDLTAALAAARGETP